MAQLALPTQGGKDGKMRFQDNGNGYAMWLSANDTYRWAHRPGQRWPCSELSGNRCAIVVDRNGICDFTMNGRSADVPGDELDAIVADHLPDSHKGFWPVWGARNDGY